MSINNLLFGVLSSKVSSASPVSAFTIPSNGIFLWSGTSATIPAGVALETSASSCWIQCATDGGLSLTKTSGSAHSHNYSNTGTRSAHNHTTSTMATSIKYATQNIPSAGFIHADEGHAHILSGVTVSSSDSHFHTIAVSDVVNNYPYSICLWHVKATTDNLNLPIGSIIMWKNDIVDLPVGSGWQYCDGTNGTLDLRNRFIFANDLDANVGTTFGSGSHTHIAPTINANSTHSHAASGNTVGSSSYNTANSGTTTTSVAGHYHSYSFTTATEAGHTHTMSTTGSAISDPQFTKLHYIQRTT